MVKKICIIGNGWYGCHAALYLLNKGLDITIIDKSPDFFTGSSSKNQNRLHIGFHYPRSDKTIKECKSGYIKFLNIYPEFTSEIDSNYYFIHDTSFVKFKDYCKVYNLKDNDLTNINKLPFKILNVNDKCIRVEERYIDNEKAKTFFKEKLNPYFKNIKNINLSYSRGKIKINDYEFDHVINCTNNQWIPIRLPFTPIFESFCSLVYKIDFGELTSITIMDGPYFSIYPYDIKNNLYTVTHVKYGIISQDKDFYINEDIDIDKIRLNIEEDIINTIPNIKNMWSYHSYFVSPKTKYDLITDDRSIRIFSDTMYTSFSGGKITGIFEMEPILDSLML